MVIFRNFVFQVFLCVGFWFCCCRCCLLAFQFVYAYACCVRVWVCMRLWWTYHGGCCCCCCRLLKCMPTSTRFQAWICFGMLHTYRSFSFLLKWTALKSKNAMSIHAWVQHHESKNTSTRSTWTITHKHTKWEWERHSHQLNHTHESKWNMQPSILSYSSIRFITVILSVLVHLNDFPLMQLEEAEKSAPNIVNGNFLNMVARIWWFRFFLGGKSTSANGNSDDKTTIATIKKISKLATTTTTTTATFSD